MAFPLTDIVLRHVLQVGLNTIRANPDRHIRDIFGDAKLDPIAALYGEKTINDIKDWILKTKIPIKRGFDVVESEMPCITIHLSGATQRQALMGDYGDMESERLGHQDKEVLVKSFVPKSIDKSDPIAYKIELPDSMTLEEKEMVMPGLTMRDAGNREYPISADCDGNVLILQGSQPLAALDITRLEVVSPVIEARFDRGAMIYDDSLSIVVHGHSSRNEGLWLYYIVMWTLLKFRPLMIGTFGLDLGVPTASDFSKDESYQGEQIWRRYISMSCTSVWTWEQARQKDLLALLMGIKFDRVDN
jgi:hypothetical protein